MPWARASTLERHLECQAASWLPRLERGRWQPGYLQVGTVDLPPDPTEMPNTEAADWGTAMHQAKAGTGQDPQSALVGPFIETLWPPQLGVHEQAVAYNCRTGEMYTGPSNLPTEEMDAWKNAQDADCVVGTCDWWAALPSGEPWIDDLKTGWRVPEVVTPQTLFYLLCKCRLEGQTYGRISITHWPRRNDEPTREGLWRQVSGLALDAFELDLQTAWRKAMSGPAAQPGPWCQYCPSAGACDRAFELE